jgi:hypothetical protein
VQRSRVSRLLASCEQEIAVIISLQDICWLRMAASKAGTQSIPHAESTRLVNAKLIQTDTKGVCMRITARGALALRRLG